MVLVATQVKRRRGTTAENDAFTGAEGEIVVDTERHELRVHDGVTQGGFKIGGGSGSGRNIGDIFMTKRTDTALAGAVECNGGTYNTTDYAGDGSIGELLESGKLDYISLTDYATAISTKGWCDKIGWNGIGTTSFRVPTLTPRIIQTNSIPVVGNGVTLGLTDGTTNYGLGKTLVGNIGILTAGTNWFDKSTGTSSAPGTTPPNNISIGVSTDPTKSGIIADTSDTAQLRVMIQLTGGATDEAFATCSEVLADVGNLKTLTEGMIDYVVESQEPTAENGYTWYRKYKSGWVEQGGKATKTNTATQQQTFTMPIQMANNEYQVQAHIADNIQTDYVFEVQIKNQTTTGFDVRIIASYQTASWTTNYSFAWVAFGMSAQ